MRAAVRARRDIQAAAGVLDSAPDHREGVSAATVKTHLHNLYAKLGVSDRAAAVAAGMRRGLIS